MGRGDEPLRVDEGRPAQAAFVDAVRLLEQVGDPRPLAVVRVASA